MTRAKMRHDWGTVSALAACLMNENRSNSRVPLDFLVPKFDAEPKAETVANPQADADSETAANPQTGANSRTGADSETIVDPEIKRQIMARIQGRF